MAKQLFQYSPFIEYAGEVTEESGKRQYMSKCGLSCASTTTVLSQYEDLTNDKGEDILEAWGNKMREQGQDPDEISAESARVGTAAHALIESYLIDGVYPLGSLAEQKLACTAIDNFYSHVDPEYAQCEQPLFFHGNLQKKPEEFMLAGRYDNLVTIPANTFKIMKTGEILPQKFVICDLKTKRSYEKLKKGGVKLKSLGRSDNVDFMFKNCLQASFYAAALTLGTDFKKRYGAGITGAVLVYVNEERSKLAYLSHSDLNYYWKIFKDILRDFYGIKPLEKSWKQMISDANWRPDYVKGGYTNNIPKEIVLCGNS
ncbi:exonuclease [Pseudanabaena phage Pam2]|nr:exonuclease [Pseudanabaena phage Pam2]